MSLRKGILHGKEHRTEFGTKNEPYCKLVDPTCRNHGGRSGGAANQCFWCKNNRIYHTKKWTEAQDQAIKNFLKGN